MEALARAIAAPSVSAGGSRLLMSLAITAAEKWIFCSQLKLY